MLKVNKSIIWEPERDGHPRLFSPFEIPADIMDCRAWIKVSGDAGVFEMQKSKKDGNRKN